MIPEIVLNKGDRVLYQGDTIRFSIPVNTRGTGGTLTPVDVSAGFTGKMQFRETADSADALLTLTSEVDGGLTMGNGKIDGVITAAQAAAITASHMVSDCQVTETSSGEKKTADASVWRVQKEITKDA